MAHAVPRRAICDRGVSPIIAVILLVAITVVLASVMYITISALVPSNPQTVLPVGISITRTEPNWTVQVVSVQMQLATSDVLFSITYPNGSYALHPTSLSTVSGLFFDTAPLGMLSIGDYLLLPVSQYPARCKVIFANSQSVMFVGELW